MTSDSPGAEEPTSTGSRITSLALGGFQIAVCWGFGFILIGLGTWGTLFRDASSAPLAVLITAGTALLFVALMGRIPLRLEVAGAKMDASYLTDQAFDAGVETGKMVESAEIQERVLELKSKIPSGSENENFGALIDDLFRQASSEPQQIQNELTGEPVKTAKSSTQPPYRGHGWFYSDAPLYLPSSAGLAAGVTAKQLRYWTRAAIVNSAPGLRHTTDLYRPIDIVALKVVKRLMQQNLTLAEVRDVMQEFYATSPRKLRHSWIIGGPDGLVLVDKTAASHRAHSAWVPIGTIMNEVVKKLEGLPTVEIPDD